MSFWKHTSMAFLLNAVMALQGDFIHAYLHILRTIPKSEDSHLQIFILYTLNNIIGSSSQAFVTKDNVLARGA